MREQQLWDQWFATRSDDARNQLIAHYKPFLETIVDDWAGRFECDPAELSSGVFGLNDAICRYDQRMGPFERFAREHVFVAMAGDLAEMASWAEVTKKS